MASCQTVRWGPKSNSPYVKLTVTQSASTDTTATLSWTLQYIADYAAYVSDRSYTVKIAGETVKNGTYALNGVTGTKTIASGTKTINKLTAAKTVNFSCSFAFELTWSGQYKGTLSASSSISVAAKTHYTITYNANGGAGAPSSQTKWYGKALTLSSTKPTRTGYTFKGWGTSSSSTTVAYASGGSYTNNASATLYAVWQALTYTVSYNANKGSGAPANQTKTYGKALTLSSTKPTRTGYTFKGWGTSSSSTTVAYASGGSYTNNASATLYAIWTLAYTKPKITSLSVTRSNSSGTVSDEGTNAKVTFSWSTYNTLTNIVIKALLGTTVVKSVTLTPGGKSGTVSQVIGSNALSVEKTYTIKITVTDSGGSTNASKVLGSIRYPIDVLKGGKGVSFGKTAQNSNYVDFGWSACFDSGLSIYGVSTSGDKRLALQPMNENNNTIIGFGNYNTKSGNTHIYGHDINFGVSNCASGSESSLFKVYLRKGDSITNLGILTAGQVTNGGKDVYFIVPLSRVVIDSPTITATSVNGFVLRQNGKYTHGSGYSSGYVYAKPTSYSVHHKYGIGLVIVATFSNTTNVINNSTIGVLWSGNIVLS